MTRDFPTTQLGCSAPSPTPPAASPRMITTTIKIVLHQPEPIDAGVPAYAVALAELGRAGRLVIYGGAGISLAEPAGLPTGAAVAKGIYDRLRDAFPAIAGVNEHDLVAVADAVAVLASGEEALRLTAARVAEFTSATPTYGHRVLALLLLEGVVEAMTTNWDDCIERGGGGERVSSIVTEHDLLHVAPRAVLKIHGCATQPASLLITSAHLASPPSWVSDQTRARLGTAVVVFVGIGDVAGYVRVRIEEALADAGPPANVRIVSPGINDGWDGSQWAELLPNLDPQQRIAMTADAFLEKVGSGFVHIVLASVAAELGAEAELAAYFHAASSGLRTHDPATVLQWARHTGVVAEPGSSVLDSPAMSSALLAVGKLFGPNFTLTREGTIETDEGQYEVLVAVGTQSASRLRREAQNRLERHLGNGIEPKFLVSGGVGWPAAEPVGDHDILGGGLPGDVVDGPINATAEILRAELVIAG